MKSWFPSVLEAGLYLLCFAVTAWMFLPSGCGVDEGVAAPIKTARVIREQQKGSQETGIPAEKLAGLFGWRQRPSSPKPGSTGVKPPMESAVKETITAGWIVFVGVIKENDGNAVHYFKDTKTGRVLKASKIQGQQEWQIVEEKSSDFVLKNADGAIKVRK